MMRLGVVVLACACSTTPAPQPVPCTAHFAGDVDDTGKGTSCGETQGDAGSVFAAHASGAAIAALDVSIALPASSGDFSSEAQSTTWSASATFGDAGCAFVGGSASVPSGSYTLSIDASGHGTLTMVLEVQSPAATDCGPRDVENVELTF